MEKTESDAAKRKLSRSSAERSFVRTFAEDEVTTFGSAEVATRFVGGVGRLDYLSGEGKVFADQSPDAWRIIAWRSP